jgi:hypothetical protein
MDNIAGEQPNITSSGGNPSPFGEDLFFVRAGPAILVPLEFRFENPFSYPCTPGTKWDSPMSLHSTMDLNPYDSCKLQYTKDLLEACLNWRWSEPGTCPPSDFLAQDGK